MARIGRARVMRAVLSSDGERGGTCSELATGMRQLDRVMVALLPFVFSGCVFPQEDADVAVEEEAEDGRLHAPPVIYHDDGTVETSGQLFATVVDFQQSADFRTHGRRCGTVEPPRTLRAAPADCSATRTSITAEYTATATLVIPVVFHIVKKTDGTGDIPDALIHSQMEVLNEDFNALAGTPGGMGTPGRIRFVLATTDPMGQPTTGIRRVTNDAYFADGSGMRTALRWDTRRYLNIYTNNPEGLLGYASFPQSSAGTATDGVVLNYTTVGRNAPMGGHYDQGRTATHEVGHYLGLYHTFQSGCGTSTAPYTTGDLISDTVAHASEQYICTPAASTCAGGGQTPINNYMNYTTDICMTKFTAEQVNRMRCSLVNYRQQLALPDKPPTAAFSTTIDWLTVSFTDESTDADGTIKTRTWMFGDGAGSTEQHIVHVYAAAGTYTVSLEITDDGGGSQTHTAQVTVSARPDPNDPNCEGPDCNNSSSTTGGCGCGASGAPSTAALALVCGLLVARRRRRRYD
jgi:uncharacterized protein (TIGR03382 family)